MLDRELYKQMQKLLAKHGLSKVIQHVAEAQGDLEMLEQAKAAEKHLKDKVAGKFERDVDKAEGRKDGNETA